MLIFCRHRHRGSYGISTPALFSNDNAECELAWSNVGGPTRIYRHLWNGMLKASERDEKRVHPTQKPTALFVWLLERYTQPGDVILDPYMGSGPCAAACQRTGRCYLGIEIVAHYVDLAIQRLVQRAMVFD